MYVDTATGSRCRNWRGEHALRILKVISLKRNELYSNRLHQVGNEKRLNFVGIPYTLPANKKDIFQGEQRES